MSWYTRGQDYSDQCPKCDAPLRWRVMSRSADRINDAREQHEPGCPAAALDPSRLRRMTVLEIDHALANPRREPGDDTGEPDQSDSNDS